jgi:integrase
MFAGCLNQAKRHKPGSKIFRDGYYWIPLIAALSGMRITEIVQLATTDVDADSDGHVFRVRGDAALNQSLKTSSSWRPIPVHRRLVELGLLDYVAKRAQDTDDHRLFANLPVAGTGGAGGEFSKWFGRYLHRIELKKTGLVFHSFRHGFADALREVSAPGYVVKDLLGHSSSDVTSGYGTKTTMATARHWVNKLTLLDDLPPPSSASSDD